MPHVPVIASAIKRARQNERRHVTNRIAKIQLRGALKGYRRALETGSGDAAALYRKAASELDKAVHKGVIHKNAANRKKSRLAKKLNVTA